MSVTIREMRPEDARRFLEIHHAAVRGIAAKDYPTSVVEAWARPITRSWSASRNCGRAMWPRMLPSVGLAPLSLIKAMTDHVLAAWADDIEIRHGPVERPLVSADADRVIATEEDLMREMREAYRGRFVSGHDPDVF